MTGVLEIHYKKVQGVGENTKKSKKKKLIARNLQVQVSHYTSQEERSDRDA